MRGWNRPISTARWLAHKWQRHHSMCRQRSPSIDGSENTDNRGGAAGGNAVSTWRSLRLELPDFLDQGGDHFLAVAHDSEAR